MKMVDKKEKVVDRALKEWFLQVRKKTLVLMDHIYIKKRGPGKENGERLFRCDERMVSTLEKEGEHQFHKSTLRAGKCRF